MNLTHNYNEKYQEEKLMFLVAVGNKGKLPNDKDNLLIGYMYLIGKIARNFKNISEKQETLEEVGYIGLLNAVNLYDQQKPNLDFKSYAKIMITEEIHHYLMDHTYKVEQPVWLISLNRKINEFVIKYRHENQKYPQLSEIADYLNITSMGLQEVLKSRESIRETYLAHQLEHDFSKIQPEMDKIKSTSYQHFKLPIEDIITLQKALLKLKKMQRNIVYYLFIMDLRATRAAQMIGLSNGRVNQIKNDIFHNSV
jgi:RNA polymerase sigma-B factor